jgi:hypothetical protein
VDWLDAEADLGFAPLSQGTSFAQQSGSVTLGGSGDKACQGRWRAGWFRFYTGPIAGPWRRTARISHTFELFQKRFARVGWQDFEHFGLEVQRDLSKGSKALPAQGLEPNPTGAAILRIGRPANQPKPLHPVNQGRHRVRVAAHAPGQSHLGQPRSIALGQITQNGVLIRSATGVGNPPPKGLVQPVPRPAKQNRQPTSRDDGGRGWRRRTS